MIVLSLVILQLRAKRATARYADRRHGALVVLYVVEVKPITFGITMPMKNID